MNKKVRLISLIIVITFMLPNVAMAAERKIGTAKTYEESLKQITIWEPDSDFVANTEQGNIIPELPPIAVLQGGVPLKGKFSYQNYDCTKPGMQEITWVFTPINTTIEPVSGTVKVNVIASSTEANVTDEVTAPSLTATSVQLNTLTSYDINLDNKISGSTYQWTSSDTDVVEVNSKSGLLKAGKEGKATITCKVTTPDSETYNLTSNVVVGYDDNAPVLTETNIDLSIGDTYDINLENKVAKSKYRWASSDRSIVKINSATGKVKAVGDGNAFVTCTITTPDNQVIVLRCDINVTE